MEIYPRTPKEAPIVRQHRYQKRGERQQHSSGEEGTVRGCLQASLRRTNGVCKWTTITEPVAKIISERVRRSHVFNTAKENEGNSVGR